MSPQPDLASFKDPAGHVYVESGRVFRQLNANGKTLWSDMKSQDVFDQLIQQKKVIPTWESSADPLVLEHEKIPFLSYAYEWPFALLKKAAMLHLTILEDLLFKGFILKDAIPLNVQFQGVHPYFIDILSIEKHVKGDPWAGYSQFCDTMLYPLMLTAYKGVPYHGWLRGQPQGFDPESFSGLFGLRDLFRSGIFSHVKLRSMMHRNWNDPAQAKRSDIQKRNFPISAIRQNVKNLQKLVAGLTHTSTKKSFWRKYTETHTYSNKEIFHKKELINQTLKTWKPNLLWDVGTNTGEFAEIAAGHASTVVAMDQDEQVVDLLAERCAQKSFSNILPLVVDWANPTPGTGWDHKEGKGLFEREKPDAILALALTHHLAIKSNVPFGYQFKKFAGLSKKLIIEYVDREDPMFKSLITNVGIPHQDYNEEEFIKAAKQNYAIEKIEPVTKTRKVFILAKN